MSCIVTVKFTVGWRWPPAHDRYHLIMNSLTPGNRCFSLITGDKHRYLNVQLMFISTICTTQNFSDSSMEKLL